MNPETLPAVTQAAPWSTIGSIALGIALLLAAFLLGGCASITKQLDQFPAANADEVLYTRTGKFSSTTITVKGYQNNGRETTAHEITVRHSNAWMPNLEFSAKGYRRIHEIPDSEVPSEYPIPIIPDRKSAPEPESPPAAPSAGVAVKP